MTISKQTLKESVINALLKIVNDTENPVKYRAWAIERLEVWTNIKKPRKKDKLQDEILKRLKEKQ